MKLPRWIFTLAVAGCMAGAGPLCAYASAPSSDTGDAGYREGEERQIVDIYEDMTGNTFPGVVLNSESYDEFIDRIMFRQSQDDDEQASREEDEAPVDAPAEKAPAATSSGSYEMPSGSGILTWSGGVNYYDGHMETWYTMREWKGELGIPGMYIGYDGIVRDGDGYICVASDDLPKGTVVDTSLGIGKVYDCGPGSGIVDIYTDWPLY